MLEINFQQSLKDIKSSQMYMFKTTPTLHNQIKYIQYGTTAFLVLVAGFYIYRGDNYVFAMVQLVMAGSAFFLIPFSYNRRVSSQIENVIKKSHQSFIGNYSLFLGENDFIAISNGEKTIFPWAVLERVELTQDYLFIVLSGFRGVALPRDRVSESEIQEAYKIFSSHLKTKA